MQKLLIKIILVAGCSSWLCSAFAADNLPMVKPEDVGFSSEQLDKIEQGIIKISKYLNESKPFLKTN